MSPTLQSKIERIIQSNKHKVKSRHIHFSFFVKRNRIICYGFNKVFFTHPLSARFQTRFNDIHSELAAISRFPYRIRELKDYDLINVRVRRDNNKFALARPCSKCIKMLLNFGIYEVSYSNEIGGFSHERIS